MATLRRYSIVKTTKPALFSPDKAILALFCVAAGGAAFLTVNNAGQNAKLHLANGKPVIEIPIASHIAKTLNKVSDGLNNKKAKAKRLRPDQIATLLREKKLQSETIARLALERRQRAAQIFSQRNNVDRTPVASIRPAASGFTEIAKPLGAPGFQELVRPQR